MWCELDYIIDGAGNDTAWIIQLSIFKMVLGQPTFMLSSVYLANIVLCQFGDPQAAADVSNPRRALLAENWYHHQEHVQSL